MNLPYGVIFDMDGVLVDSEPFICKAACMMYDEKGLNVKPEDFKPFIGKGENRYLNGVAEKYNFPVNIEKAKKRTYDIYLEIIKGELQPLPGVFEYIDKCKQLDKKISVASSADLRKVKGNLEEINLPFEEFEAVITGEDVEHKKPSPDIFLLAAEKMSLDAKDCLVVEDAVSGVKAAKQAGAKCLAITGSFSKEELNGADFYAENLKKAPEDSLNWKN